MLRTLGFSSDIKFKILLVLIHCENFLQKIFESTAGPAANVASVLIDDRLNALGVLFK